MGAMAMRPPPYDSSANLTEPMRSATSDAAAPASAAAAFATRTTRLSDSPEKK